MTKNNLEDRVDETPGCYDRTFIMAGLVIATITIYQSVRCNLDVPRASIDKRKYEIKGDLNFGTENVPSNQYRPLEEENK